MDKIFFLIGSILGGLGVALGAFGAHGLKSMLPPDQLQTFQTGVTYQMYHAFALLFAGFAVARWSTSRLPVPAGWLFVAGVVLFSGSLYLLSLTGNRLWGAVTPFGGLAFIAGWVLLAITVLA
jgi:uncharacterized membrane protein YgdD (TMEM256/DUF423 family)